MRSSLSRAVLAHQRAGDGRGRKGGRQIPGHHQACVGPTKRFSKEGHQHQADDDRSMEAAIEAIGGEEV